jgi:hypothetical protein
MRYIEINKTSGSNIAENSLELSADQNIYIYIYIYIYISLPKLRVKVSFFFWQYNKSICQDNFPWIDYITTLIVVPPFL